MAFGGGTESGSNTPAGSATVETKLVDTLFEQQGSIVISQVATVAVGALAYAESLSPWVAAWIGMVAVIMPWRLMLARAYARRRPTDTIKKWTNLFAAGAVMTALGYGLVASYSVLRLDDSTQRITITGLCAFVAGAAMRNCVVPEVARAQICVSLGSLAVACIATGRLLDIMYAAAVLMFMTGMMDIVRFTAERTRAMFLAQAEAERANLMLEALAATDPLTGVVNRRGFDAVLARAFEAASRDRHAFSLLLLDIDHFKAMNDVYGHQSGDECLRAVARRMSEIVCRPGDTVARYGGEEFAILLAESDEAGALATANVVRHAIEALEIRHPTSASGVTTISIGYAVALQNGFDDQAALIKRADNALYRAKSTGRNRVVGPTCSDEPRIGTIVRLATA